MKKFLLGLLAAVLWLLDFDNILVFLLIPGGLIALGIMTEAGWVYYPIALGIYGSIVYAVNRAIDKAAEKSVERLGDWLKKRKK